MQKLFEIANQNISKTDFSQVTVLLSSKNNIYTVFDDFDGNICDELLENNDTEILKMISIWKTGQVDLQSIKFRKSLVKLNINNLNTNIILQAINGLIYKKLSVTI